MTERTTAPQPRTRALGTARGLVRKPAARLGFALALTTPVLAAGVSATPAEDTAEQVLESATESTTDGAAALADFTELSERADRASRSAVRTVRPVTLKPKAVTTLWTTAPLTVWTEPGNDAAKVGLIKPSTKLRVTGQRDRGRAEVLLGEERNDRWVTARYLAESKPKAQTAAASGGSSAGGVSAAPCPDGSDIEAGLTSNADRVYRAVCNAFPQLTTYGGLDPHGEHVDGRAIDFMTSDQATGDAIAAYLRANAGTFGLRNVIWYQQIWSAERSSEGWRYYGDYGSATANHLDHVHVSVY